MYRDVTVDDCVDETELDSDVLGLVEAVDDWLDVAVLEAVELPVLVKLRVPELDTELVALDTAVLETVLDRVIDPDLVALVDAVDDGDDVAVLVRVPLTVVVSVMLEVVVPVEESVVVCVDDGDVTSQLRKDPFVRLSIISFKASAKLEASSLLKKILFDKQCIE
jgi:hypothetical protein